MHPSVYTPSISSRKLLAIISSNIPHPPFCCSFWNSARTSARSPDRILHVWNTSLDYAALGGEGSSVFTSRAWKSYMPKSGKLLLTSRLARAVLPENSLHEITARQAETKRSCGQSVAVRTGLKCTLPRLASRSLGTTGTRCWEVTSVSGHPTCPLIRCRGVGTAGTSVLLLKPALPPQTSVLFASMSSFTK